ncbi:substrate-binding domain-containing protein [Pedobacter sp. MC2016-14]|uniref:LacI family DNA-binding transcriptional regulator n=1 Tax=Pedobacter sp. MC2016-14 TaxID=2897327 RepID=UPI001E5578AC|nr:substrate-binding domain-containing protein [Pedobacter sp. MC2016-14]MCD0487488.1 substrate-binding domain-containing protein [Pedobacter sp. MC2016-14]
MQSNKPELTGVKEIARRANVSIGTVDRVLNNRTGVSEKTKARILEIIQELDYQPNILARRLASKKTLNIAVLIPSVSSETNYWQAPLEGINEAEAEVKRYGITIDKYFFDQNDKQSFMAQTVEILKRPLDGVLMAPMFMEESRVFADECKKLNVPYLFINSDIPGHNSLCYIGPELHQSGCVAADLIRYLVAETDEVLVVNISREIDNLHHLLRKEEGFRDYLIKHEKKNPVVKLDIRDTSYLAVKRELAAVLNSRNIKAIFVTNSRVSSVAQYLEESNTNGIKLIGYDFLEENIEYLKKGIIEFLISQKPKEQGYKGIITLYNYLVHSMLLGKTHFMPIDIITKENYSFYKN